MDAYIIKCDLILFSVFSCIFIEIGSRFEDAINHKRMNLTKAKRKKTKRNDHDNGKKARNWRKEKNSNEKNVTWKEENKNYGEK